MPFKNRRSTALVVCTLCGREFHPFRGREETQRYCSLACSRAAGILKVEELRSAGVPVGGAARKAVRASQAARVTASESPAAERTRGNWQSLRAKEAEKGQRARSAPSVAAPGYQLADIPDDARSREGAREGDDWLASGVRYERFAARHLEREGSGRLGRTLIITGYGAGIRVERDALIVTEGHTHNPQTPAVHTLYRGMHDVGRIVCLNPEGSLSFPAVRWCAEQDIALILLGRDGSLLSTFTPESRGDVKLRRLQYQAQANGRDVALSHQIVRRKLAGQLATARAHPELPDRRRALEALEVALSWLSLEETPPWLQSLEMLRTYEGRAARAYFAAWAGLPLRWAKADARRVPPHWLSVRERTSPLSSNSNARRAADPANAILNYAYAVLEGQARQALSARGFDLACGFLHADREGRDSLVYDAMELERPAVDGLVLDFLQRATFRRGDFTSVSDGTCRLHPQLARAVVAACRVPQGRLDAHARWLAMSLLSEDPATTEGGRSGVTGTPAAQ
jgi:CRISPR-associated protein Cas1